ncbi:MAG: pilus assembly protein N-terminal domain-containing protein [Hyphomicrobiales bacterium]|nr:pilus assembly protein N-terminal domain-containing protein [Hyphomicrobiales bacterium]
MRNLSRARILASRIFFLASLSAVVIIPLGAAHAEKLVVTTDKAKIIKLPGQTKTVIVGNPIVADVTIGKDGLVILTGKSFGTTNLIALDGAGAILNESTIQVQQPNENLVIMQRGMDRETYSCTPTCMPSVALGDEQKYFTDTGTASSTRNKLATEK